MTMTMAPTREERREVAEELRNYMRLRSSDTFEAFYTRLNGVLFGDDGFDRPDGDVFERLADLFDPTCHNQHPRASDGCFCCSECLFLHEPTDCRNGGFLYCPRCGARVIRGGED